MPINNPIFDSGESLRLPHFHAGRISRSIHANIDIRVDRLIGCKARVCRNDIHGIYNRGGNSLGRIF